MEQLQNLEYDYNTSTLILEIRVVDGGMRKLYRDKCSIFNKKELSRIFQTLKVKFNIDVPESLKEDTGLWLG